MNYSPTNLRWHWLGRVGYQRALLTQRQWRDQVTQGHSVGAVLLLEHPPVITLGRSATDDNVVVSRHELDTAGISVERIERGGDVTYHGPGQLMIYCIVRIPGVVVFLEAVASTIVDTLSVWGINAQWRRDPAGVWVGDAKVAACGIHVSRSVVTHGFALNVATPPAAWKPIRPCGLSSPVISVEQALAGSTCSPTVEDAAIELGPRLCSRLATIVRPSV
jgi:lipoyl(octanoyl) transferase